MHKSANANAVPVVARTEVNASTRLCLTEDQVNPERLGRSVRYWFHRYVAKVPEQDVEDLAHDGLVKAIQSYRSEKGKWWTWVFLAHRTIVLDYLRKERRWKKLRGPGGNENPFEHIPGRKKAPDEMAEIKERLARVHLIVDSLSPPPNRFGLPAGSISGLRARLLASLACQSGP
jgi:RNA polymerase sigma factor (sigma-70 family)